MGSKQLEPQPISAMIVASYRSGLSLTECARLYGRTFETCRRAVQRWAPEAMRPQGPEGHKAKRRMVAT